MIREKIKLSKRVVVKVGTRILTDQNGKLNLIYIEKVIKQIADLRAQGKEVLLVSSGAIGAGIGKLNLATKPTILAQKQAVAAIGQGHLIQLYEKLFAKYQITIAQILLTREDLRDRKRYLNSRNTLLSLLKYGVIPIINENDTVATEEIEFGDNDTLSALVGSLVGADLLIILSTVDGLYSKNPEDIKNKKGECKLINYVPEITKKIMSYASNSGAKLGTGGMFTKLQAANIAVDSGVDTILANGKKEGIIKEIFNCKNVGTYIPAKKIALSLRKRWLAYGPLSQGSIIIDDGAKKAIVNFGKSLLPSGIIDIKGSFNKGEMVKVETMTNFVGRGLTNYSSADLTKIKGLQSKAIIDLFGQSAKKEAVHRDKLVIRVD